MVNNKGMTLVELLVTFSLLLVLVIGMFNLIMEVKTQLDEKQVAKDFTEYSSMINNDIHYDLLKKKPFAIVYKNESGDGWKCQYNIEGSCLPNTTTNNGYTFKLDGSSDSVLKSYTTLDELCSNIYPCAVYAYKSGNGIDFKTIALNRAGSNNDSGNKLLQKHGIKYNDVYESIPDQEYVDFKSNPSIEYIAEDSSAGSLVIDFSFYMIEHDKNYGFKIAYPFEQEPS